MINTTIAVKPHNMNLQFNTGKFEISSHLTTIVKYFCGYNRILNSYKKVQYDKRYTSRVHSLDSALTTYRSHRGIKELVRYLLPVVDLESRVFCTAGMLHYIFNLKNLINRTFKSHLDKNCALEFNEYTTNQG